VIELQIVVDPTHAGDDISDFDNFRFVETANVPALPPSGLALLAGILIASAGLVLRNRGTAQVFP
jgi:hypothetical protein